MRIHENKSGQYEVTQSPKKMDAERFKAMRERAETGEFMTPREQIELIQHCMALEEERRAVLAAMGIEVAP